MEPSVPDEQTTRLRCVEVPPSRPVSGIADDVRRGLLIPPRSLPPKYFYDERGSWLFDRICDTPEYYPTRTEDALLAQWSRTVVEGLRPHHVVELGAGASRKTRHVLDACHAAGSHCTYWPFDVCGEIMVSVGEELIEAYPWLSVNPLIGDYLGGLGHLPVPAGRVLYLFLGGTLGNFEPPEAVQVLGDLRRVMGTEDRLLLGVDRVKARDVLESAYNDAQGVTAEFNLNVLNVLNRELGGDLDPTRFAHEAVYNEAEQRIEMYLVARDAQRARLSSLEATLELEAGERILTEISRKFTPESLSRLMREAGFVIERHFEPDNQYFSLALLAPA